MWFGEEQHYQQPNSPFPLATGRKHHYQLFKILSTLNAKSLLLPNNKNIYLKNGVSLMLNDPLVSALLLALSQVLQQQKAFKLIVMQMTAGYVND